MKYSTGLLEGFRRVGKALDVAGGEDAVDVGRLAWLAGDWRGIGGDEFVQESWLTPVNGCMTGLFRKISNEHLVMHEYRFIAREGEHIILRCRRYFGDEPAKRGPVNMVLCLIEMSTAYAVFESVDPASELPGRITYQRNDDRLVVTETSGIAVGGDAGKTEFHLVAR